MVSHAGAAAMHRKNVESSFGLHQFACKAIEYIFRLPRVVVIRLGPSRSLKIHKYHCLCRENKVEATAHLVVETEFGPACPFFLSRSVAVVVGISFRLHFSVEPQRGGI